MLRHRARARGIEFKCLGDEPQRLFKIGLGRRVIERGARDVATSFGLVDVHRRSSESDALEGAEEWRDLSDKMGGGAGEQTRRGGAKARGRRSAMVDKRSFANLGKRI